MPEKHHTTISRREFVKTTALGAALAGVAPRFVHGAEPDKPLKVGLVGCGGRGTRAARDAMKAAPKVTITALADVFPDKLSQARRSFEDAGPIEEKNCFVGLDACRKMVETDVDYVILATPPYYRPEHLALCVEAGKHVFMEKPLAVDPVGVRKILEAGRKAGEKHLSLVAGTQRRHQNGYIETIKRIHDGAIGKIVAAQCYWNTKHAKYDKRQAGWSDMDWMIRDWNNWTWLSGDHVVEQHVHNIDVINWVLAAHPEKVVAMGGRHRRITGDQYDFFCADLFYPDNVHVLSQCRQINGCATEISERVIGTKGVSNCNGWISTMPPVEAAKNGPYVQEHADLIAAIRKGEPLNEAQAVAESTMCAIMIRMSAYTGQEVTWDHAMKSDEVLGPPDYAIAEASIRAHLPVPGQA